MAKEVWRPGNMLYPLPCVLVSCADTKGNKNMLTVAWTGTVCSDPAMVYVSVRKERHSYKMIEETGEFVINLTTEKLARATDFAGVRSGKNLDKAEVLNLSWEPAQTLTYAPAIAQSPVNIECKVTEAKDLGSHTMFLALVTSVSVDDAFIDEAGTFKLNEAGLITYCHGSYRSLGKKLGTFGWSVQKRKKKQKDIKGKSAAKHPGATQKSHGSKSSKGQKRPGGRLFKTKKTKTRPKDRRHNR